MTTKFRDAFIAKARELIIVDDSAHDISHALRVMTLAEKIAKSEGADLEVVIPAALFHDVVIYPKNHPKSKFEADESAEKVGEILKEFPGYPAEKIPLVQEAIREHTFSKRLIPTTLEGKVVQDADRLDSTGAISIMRTFSSCGQMGIKLYREEDPFCEHREPESLIYALDLFYNRLLKVGDMMNTKHAKDLAVDRTKFLHVFLTQFKGELEGTL